MKNTIVINLFAGPGAGKSTGSSCIFSELKLAGIDAELVTEYAKDKVWENNQEAFKCQFLITGKQVYRVSKCYGKVDVIVTDAPICLGAIYDSDHDPAFEESVVNQFKKFNKNGLNFFLNRVKPYNPNGRLQTESEACEIDGVLKEFMKKHEIEYTEVNGDKEGYLSIVNQVIEKLKDNDNGEK